MNILAIETTGHAASVAIVCPDRIIAEHSISNQLTHSQVLLPMIDNMLTTAGFDKRDINLVACSSGPGSFTGLRIGAAAAKGLAFGLGIKIVPVATLDALAYNVSYRAGAIVPIMDARRDQVYTAVYACHNGKIQQKTDYLACDMDYILAEAAKTGENVMFLGDGVAVHHQKIAAHGFCTAPATHMLQRAASVGAIALKNTHHAVAPRDFAPFYIRLSQAERERDCRPKKETI
ncbi:MAG: tRNA (adenosine(37)-N6)-threonylcarbamoyltransferase complex dimerization subunit type 1 TsaB [Defluviitaleaceae bacterium]|nr:tRNA (adenosine(37)-N6)-threonylcarbamoyltransferase complex dimerization subunit type 1 TsaB [Defluviitaleaceae bacterium]